MGIERASWFETRGVAALLTIEGLEHLILRRREAPSRRMLWVSPEVIGYKTCAERKTAAARERRRTRQGPRSLHRAFVGEAILAVLDDGGDGFQRELAVGG